MEVPLAEILLHLEVPRPSALLHRVEGVEDDRSSEDEWIDVAARIHYKAPLVAVDHRAREDTAWLLEDSLEQPRTLEHQEMREEEFAVLERTPVVVLEALRGKNAVDEGREVAVPDDGEDLLVGLQHVSPKAEELRLTYRTRDVAIREVREEDVLRPKRLEDRSIELLVGRVVEINPRSVGEINLLFRLHLTNLTISM